MSLMGSTRSEATLRLEGVVGREQCRAVVRSVNRALRSCAGDVWLDLGMTRHLHYEVARVLVQTATDERRLHLVGASHYVEQILRLVGASEDAVHPAPLPGEPWEDSAG